MTEIKLPRLDDDIDESVVIFWHKQVDDYVKKGDILVEVQTEKAVTELESEANGVLTEIKVKRGEVASVGDVLCIIGDEVSQEKTGETSEMGKEEKVKEKRPFVRVAPRLRRIAKELNVDLVEVQEAIGEEKITEEDIRNFASIDANGKGEKLTGIRKTIATRMRESLQQTAQLTETAYADVTNLSSLREHQDVKMSWNTWILYAVIQSLQKHPYMNGTYENDLWNLSEDVHLGIATDVSEGLVVPVVKNAHKLSLEELDEEVKRLVQAAHDKKVTSDQLSCSTFTVTNLGSYGIHFFTQIINPPEVAILGLGQIETYLTLDVGEVVEKKRVPLSLTFDHQIIDGAPAARFLKTLTESLAYPKNI